MKEEKSKHRFQRLFIALSPILIFICLMPFMREQVPYHFDLVGNVDRVGSKWFVFASIIVFSIVIFYTYGKNEEKKLAISIGLTLMSILNVLLITATIHESENLIKGFLSYIIESYGNQVAFLLFFVSLFIFLFSDRILLKSTIGVKSAVTNKSEDAWKTVHIKSKMQFWYCAIIQIFLFFIPTINPSVKLIISLMLMLLSWFYVIRISHSVNKGLK
ncbi:DUF1648 domain-containing protein [Fusibacter bizertensis]